MLRLCVSHRQHMTERRYNHADNSFKQTHTVDRASLPRIVTRSNRLCGRADAHSHRLYENHAHSLVAGENHSVQQTEP